MTLWMQRKTSRSKRRWNSRQAGASRASMRAEELLVGPRRVRRKRRQVRKRRHLVLRSVGARPVDAAARATARRRRSVGIHSAFSRALLDRQHPRPPSVTLARRNIRCYGVTDAGRNSLVTARLTCCYARSDPFVARNPFAFVVRTSMRRPLARSLFALLARDRRRRLRRRRAASGRSRRSARS